MNTRLMLAVCLVATWGCDQRSNHGSTVATQGSAVLAAVPDEPGCMAAPWILQVTGVPLPDGTTQLHAVVDGASAFPAPLQVSLVLPKGTRILEGNAVATVPAGVKPPWSATVRVDGDPQQALAAEFVAQVVSPSSGWHARRTALGDAPPQAQPRPDPKGEQLLRNLIGASLR